jgi:hypothetical protein
MRRVLVTRRTGAAPSTYSAVNDSGPAAGSGASSRPTRIGPSRREPACAPSPAARRRRTARWRSPADTAAAYLQSTAHSVYGARRVSSPADTAAAASAAARRMAASRCDSETLRPLTSTGLRAGVSRALHAALSESQGARLISDSTRAPCGSLTACAREGALSVNLHLRRASTAWHRAGRAQFEEGRADDEKHVTVAVRPNRVRPQAVDRFSRNPSRPEHLRACGVKSVALRTSAMSPPIRKRIPA